MVTKESVLSHRWRRLWGGHTRAEAAYVDLVKKYIDNALPYHNLDHIFNCLALFDAFGELAVDRKAVEIALWYHDVIYDPQRKDNEEASSAFAGESLSYLGLSGRQRSDVISLIMATKHDRPVTTPDQKLIVDIDLAILGAPASEYAAYAAAIRQEYAWVSDQDYRAGRAKVLQSFLNRQFIYYTGRFRMKRESLARSNIAGELAELAR